MDKVAPGELSDIGVALVALAMLNAAAFVMPSGQLRRLLVIIVLCLLPGYAATTLLFPMRQPSTGATGSEDVGIGHAERAVLSFGTSIVLLMLLGFVVAAVTEVTAVTVALGVTILTVGLLAGGLVRRLARPREARYVPPGIDIVAGGQGRQSYIGQSADGHTSARGWLPVDGDSRVPLLVNVALAITVVAALSAFGFAVTAPDGGATYTEATLLTETADGELVASGYPTELSPEGQADIVLAVTNNEQETVRYTVVAQLQRLSTNGGEATVVERDRLMTERNRVTAGETWRYDHTVAPTLTGQRLRVAYLIYRGDAPDRPTVENAYRHLSFGIRVQDPTEE